MAEGATQSLSPYVVLRDPLGSDGRPGISDETAGQPLDLRSIIGVFRKHRRLIAATFCTIVVGAALVVFTTEASYRATSVIDIERDAPKIAPVQGVEMQATDDPHDYYETQYQILKNRALAARVIRALSLDSDPRFLGTAKPGLTDAIRQRLRALVRPYLPSKPTEKPTENPKAVVGEDQIPPNGVGAYLGGLGIDPIKNSRLVKISFTSRDPQLAAIVANRHVDEYMKSTLEQRLGMTAKAKEFLEGELAKSRDRVVAAEAALNQFRKDHGILSVDGDKTDLVSIRLGNLNEQYTAAQGDRIRLEAQYKLIERGAYDSLPDVASNTGILALRQQLATASTERSELAKKYKPGYPRMAALIAREQELRSQVNGETRKVIEVIRSAYRVAKNREQDFAQQLEEQRQAALRQKDAGAGYDTLKRDVEGARGLYANLLERLKDLDVAKEVRTSNIAVIEPAVPPGGPFSPNIRQSLLFAAVLGLALGIGLAFALENLDNTVKTIEDLEQTLHLPALGIVPAFGRPMNRYGARPADRPRRQLTNGAEPSENGNAVEALLPSRRNGRVEFITNEKPSSVIAEAYRTIRTGILLSTADKPPQVITFTSGASGEGKTVTTLNEAFTLAQAGAKVLVIDADVRRPRLRRLFDLDGGHGLTTYLTGQSSLESIIAIIFRNTNGNDGTDGQTLGGDLSVIPSGPVPPNPAELLGSRRMQEMLTELRRRYDYILLDTPPILPVTDAVVLSRMSDGVVLVVRGQKTPIDLVAAARDRLLKSRVRIIGAVLNALDLSTGDYEKHYRYYYSYYAEDHRPEP